MPGVVAGDPVDARLLSHVAEAGRIAVHEIAAAVGMDPREVAARLVALSATGLPLLVGVECDQKALRAALQSGAMARPHPVQPPPSAPHPVHGPPSGRYPVQGTPSGVYPVHGTPSGSYPPPGPPSGGYPVQGTPSGPHPVQGTPSGVFPQAPPGPPSGAYPVQRPPSGPHPAPQAPTPPVSAPDASAPHSVFSTWGPPQTSSWARGDQPPQVLAPPRPQRRSAGPQRGAIGDKLRGEGLDGEQVDIQLLEVVDPADFLFGAAGYRLAAGERAVVVHTELTNTSPTPYPTLPDLHLVLVTSEGRTISKAPVSLSSRPPHRIGVQPGETAGGHAVFVLPQSTPVTAVRWSARPDATEAILTWTITD